MAEYVKTPPETAAANAAPGSPSLRTAPDSLAIRCHGLRKVYDGKVEAVRGLDLEVRRGECFGLLGPNGAGKTTTIEILEGLLAPTSGDVEVLGERWGRRDRALRQRIGISLQETRLSEKLTVRETLRLFRSFHRHGLDPDTVIEIVALGSKAGALVGKLSGGQRQRLAVACALVGDPELLFLDEPTTGLDPQSRRQLWTVIQDFQRRGRTVLVTTHYMDEAERLCTRVAIVDRGQVIAQGTPADLISSLEGEHVVEFAVRRAGGALEREPGPAGDAGGLEQEANGGDPEAAREVLGMLHQLASVRSARIEHDGIALTVGGPHHTIPALLEVLRSSGMDLLRLTTRHASLEDVFVTLTGRHLREEEHGPA